MARNDNFLRAFWRARKEQVSLKTGRSFDLGKMSLPQLWMAYLTHRTISLYFGIIVAGAYASISFSHRMFGFIVPALVVIAIYPYAWYFIHRSILHARWLYRTPFTAVLWKRVHFDHHQDPHLLDVLFGSPATTLPTIAIIVMPVGYAIAGWQGSFSALTTGVVVTCIYEFFHCIQHLAYKPKSAWVHRIKQLHVLHHFHNEKGNYGITNYLPDRLFGSFFADARQWARSSHAFDLGYDLKEAQRYPWVMEHTGAPPRQRPEGARPARDIPTNRAA